MTTPVRFAISLPQRGPVTAAAQEAERLGFDLVSCGEHVFFHGPTSNAFVSLAAAAGATNRIGLLSAITLAPLYPSVLLAKLVAALDDVSDGRLTVGLGVGGENRAEFDALGVDVRERGARTDEAVKLLRLLLGSDGASFTGRFARFDDISICPRPPHGCPPLWIAGRSSAARRRAARAGDAWMPYLYSPEQLGEQIRNLRSDAQNHGRDPGAVRVAIHVFVTVMKDPRLARRQAVESVSRTYRDNAERFADRYLVFGTPQQVSRRLTEYRDAGADAFVMRLAGEGRERESMVRRLAGEVVAPLREKWNHTSVTQPANRAAVSTRAGEAAR
jgi:probable F420-dependent oxidoreductase